MGFAGSFPSRLALRVLTHGEFYRVMMHTRIAPESVMDIELSLYTPSDAEAVTKVAQTQVRNWRRAGYLSRQDGPARYTIGDLLNMSAMHELVSRGVAPSVAKPFAAEIAHAAFSNMIYSVRAFSETAQNAAAAEVGEGNPERVAQVRAALGADFSHDALMFIQTQEFLMECAERKFGLTGLKKPLWFIIWANGKMQFYHDEDISEETFFGNTSYRDPYVQGPVMLFCLGAIAQMVLDRLPRPPFKLAGEV